ncbi:fumarate hydratase [Thermodesulfatator autotrophicus]|uniref:Fumarate hydratase n=1 Tax=Thermodesulfatator autotrophicus TaxID=1795632 RepID=A0A177EA45_9BACT|nr:fumarate hydratase [Thermodesulfatator autotrophicus]OAG28391.1 fumarate hydratase [Thermodesulfatator autotrophicus]
MKQVRTEEIVAKVAQAVEEACKILPNRVWEVFQKAQKEEPSPLGKKVFDILLENARLAQEENLPICQDTGIAVIFVELGEEVKVKGLYEAINQGVAKGYEKGLLRKSVADPITRQNTGTNTPAVIHLEIVPGDKLKITVFPKGCGSENMSALKMLPPSAGLLGVKEFVKEVVKNAGPNPCPPITVGVGLGGTFEKAAYLAKKALTRPLGEPHPEKKIAELEKELLAEINTLGIGPLGFGGKITALAVHVETFPTHIASLPVAVNIQCHAARIKKLEF